MAVWLSDAQRAANGPLSRAQIAERRLKVHLGHEISTTLGARRVADGGQDLGRRMREIAANQEPDRVPPIQAMMSGVSWSSIWMMRSRRCSLRFFRRCTCNRSYP